MYSNNPKHYNILFCGDSWTYGSELDQLNPELYEYRRRNRFSHIVSEKLNKTYYNISDAGASNDWITYHAIDWFESGNTCDIAVIQFSKYGRISYYDTRNKAYKTFFLSELVKSVKNQDYIVKNLINDYAGYQNYFKNLFVLNNYLKSRGVKIIYLTIQSSLSFEDNQYWASYCKDIKMDCLLNIIDRQRGEYCIAQLDAKSKALNGCHPSVRGHSVIADHIINRINS